MLFLCSRDYLVLRLVSVLCSEVYSTNVGVPLPPLQNRKAPKEKESYQVTKQDPEELANVCRVMADLITMHNSIFTVSLRLLSVLHVS